MFGFNLRTVQQR